MNSIRLFNKAKLAFNILHPRFYAVFSRNCLKLSRKNVKLKAYNFSLGSANCISSYNSMQKKDADSSSNSDSEQFQRILEDKEFQNILHDFAKDFGVDDSKLLEDIKKDIDGSKTKTNFSAEDNKLNRDISSRGVDKEVASKYTDFSESDASIIYSYEEQRAALEENEEFYHINQEYKPKVSYADLKRGTSGVYDLEELIDVLRNESLMDITAISIPKELHYADYLVLVTAKSMRHSMAVAELILKLHKKKKSKLDPFVKVEGQKESTWKAIDMGNIVLHLFLAETRALYDLESLWLFDPDFDSGGSMESDPMISILEEQMEFFKSLQQESESQKDS